METINPIDDQFVYKNLCHFMKVIMQKFPVRFEGFLDLLAAPERPVFTMTKDEKLFSALELSISHLGSTKMAVEVRRSEPILFNDSPVLIWMKIEDPAQKLNQILMGEQDIVFNDSDRDERYYATKSTIANLAYSKSGSAILTLLPRTKAATDRYKETTGIELNQFVSSMLDSVV